MKNLLLLFTFISFFANSQEYDFQQLCLDCAEQEGYYCGDDPANWTQYAPNGCVINQWLNDGWVDCVDEGDENGAVPTLPMDCIPPPPECDTVYVEIPILDTIQVPFYIYETIFQIDTIYDINVTDTVTIYEDVLDTLFVDVIDTLEIEVVVFDTIIETEYIEFFTTDTIIEYVDVIMTEYIDCDTGLPCSSNIPEIKEQSKKIIYYIICWDRL